ncbi:NUDIX hydrolase [Nitratireductor pacificus]|nr:NUDIX domain-containing protein [Nitratireductor pacificus]
MKPEEIRAVSAVVVRDGRFLLVRRGRAPAKGLYAFPGGRIEAGETARQAVVRELFEETGLAGEVTRLHRRLRLANEPQGPVFLLDVYRATVADGTAVAGDDASEAGWFTLPEMRDLPVTDSTLAIAEELDARADA